MASIAPLTEEQNNKLKEEIEAGHHGKVRDILSGTKYKTAAFEPAQVNLPRFPGNMRMIDLAIKHAKGKTGTYIIEHILARNPDISAKILLMPEARLMYIDAIKAIIKYTGLKIDDMTNTEKGQVLLFLTLIEKNKNTGLSDYLASTILEDARIFAKKLLESGGIEPKYKNMALFYIKFRIANDLLIGDKLISFRNLLLENGAVDIVPTPNNHTGTQIQINYKKRINAIAAKELKYKTNIWANLEYLIENGKYHDEVIAYLESNEFTDEKMNMARYKHPGEEDETLLEFAFYKSKKDNYAQEVFNFLLDKPGIQTYINQLRNMVMYSQYGDSEKNKLRVQMLIEMAKRTNLFKKEETSLDDIYYILEKSFYIDYEGSSANKAGPQIIQPLLSLMEGDVDLYHVYGYHPDNFMTLYELADKKYRDADGILHDTYGVVDMLIANGGNDGSKREAAKKARRRIYFVPILAEFNKPVEGPLRNGIPSVEADAITASKADPTLWEGFTKVDEGTLKMIFEPDYDSAAPKKNPNGTFALNPDGSQIMEITRIKPSLATTFCPVCLGFTVREAGCNYMHHRCIPENIVDLTLYEKYKLGGAIFWCTICNRIANDHGHFKVSNIFGPKPNSMANNGTGDVFENDCGHLGGGGILEKIGRFHALREECKRLLPSIGTVKRKEARLLLAKAFWNAPLSNYLPIATALQGAAGWANDPFPTVAAALAAVSEPIYGMVGYNDADGTLLPEIYNDPAAPKENSVSLEEINPAIQFRHIHPGKPAEYPVTHNDIYLSLPAIFDRIKYYGTNFGAVDFGKCLNASDAECGAIIHPREIEHILTKVMADLDEPTYDAYNKSFIAYRKAYNKKVGTGAIPPPPGIAVPAPEVPVAAVEGIAAAIEGGGSVRTTRLKQHKKLRRRTSKNNKISNCKSRRIKHLRRIGGSPENSNKSTFPVLDDTYCSVTLKPLKNLVPLYNPHTGGKRQRRTFKNKNRK
jgi:hypothetical protein